MAEIAISLAISAAVSAASAGLQYALTPKPKKPATIDRGKLDDIRFSIPAYGAQIVKAWGTCRVAPTWFWHTPAIDVPITTPGQQGGKGGGGAPPTADQIEHRYFKNMAGVFHDGLIQHVRRIWFDDELVLNDDLPMLQSGTSSTRYEAENGVLSGTASIATQAECSDGRKVTGIGSGTGDVTIHCDVAATGSYEVAVGYTSTVARDFNLAVNGGGLLTLTCPASGGAGLVAVQTIRLTLNSGANTIAFTHASQPTPDLDYITIAPTLAFTDGVDPRSFTGLQTPGRLAPTDPDIAWPINDEPPVFSDPTGGLAGGGNYSATLAKWGSPQIRIYLGSETQDPDPLIESIKGVGNTSAYRGTAYIVIEGIQLQNGRAPNVTIEFVEGTRAPSAILNSLAEMVGLTPASDLDTTALNGLILGDSTGFNPGSYSAIAWTGLSNATQTAGGAITKTSGTDNAWNSYATQGTTVSAGTDAAIRFTAGSVGTYMIGFGTIATPGGALPNPYAQMPFAVLLNKNANPSQAVKNSIQMSLGGSNNTTDIGVWAPGDVFQVEIRNGRFNAYQNGQLLSGFTPPPATFPLYPNFAGYAISGGPSAASYATGSNIGSEPIITNAGALILDSQREAGELVEELMTRFQFICPEVDGKIKVVRLDAESDLTLTEAECQAYRGDGLPPKIQISRKNPLSFPKKTIVNYSDPQLSYHNNSQVETRLFGPQKGTLNVNLAMVETGANMKKLAAVLSNRAEVEGQTYNFTIGPKYKRIHQGTVLTIAEGSSTHKVRVTNFRPDLPAGLGEVEAVRQSAIFNPSVVTNPLGVEDPIVKVPGNTKLVLIDGPLLRPEDAGDGSMPVVYAALTGRGSGAWPAALLYQEFPINSGNYTKLIATSETPSGIGVTTGTLASVADPSVWDRTNSLTIDFYSNTVLESAAESDLLANPELNLLAVVNPSTGAVEHIQFKTASAGVATAPFITRYTISVFLRGRAGTDNNVGAHSSADDVAVIDSSIKVFRLSLADVGQTLRFKALTVGQQIDQVAAVSFLFNGNSLRPLAPANVRGVRDSEGDLLIRWDRRSRIAGGLRPSTDVPLAEERERYKVEIYSGSTLKRTMEAVTGMQMAAFLISELKNQFDGVTHNTFEAFSTGAQIGARSIQEVPGPDNFIEAGLEIDTGGFRSAVGLQVAGGTWRGVAASLETEVGSGDYGSTLNAASTIPYLVVLGSFGVGPFYQRFSVYENGTRTFTATSDPGDPDYDEGFGWAEPYASVGFFRVRFNFVGSSIRIQKAHTANVPLVTVAISTAAAVFPYFVVAAPGTSAPSCKVSGVTLTTNPQPGTIYSESQQIEDFGSTQSSIKVRVSQFSAVIGYGPYAEANL